MPLQKVAVSSAAFAAALAFQGCVRSNTEPADPDCPMATEEKCTTNENCYWNTTSNMCKSRQTAGNECLSDDACLSGQCFLPTGNGSAAKKPGKCAARLGDNCSTADAKSSPGGRTCASDLKCIAAKGSNNGKCQYDNPKEPNCTADEDCDWDISRPICRASAENGNTTCQAPATVGTFCERSDECQSGSCVSNKCVSTGSGKKANGEKCTAAKDCLSGFCNGKTCANNPKKANGEKCKDKTECSSGFCNTDAGKCAQNDKQKKTGEPCKLGRDCISGLCNSLYKCADHPVQPGTLGDICGRPDDPPCAHGLQCLSGKTKGDHFTCKAEATSERGEFCASEDDCMEEGFICDKDGKYCTPPDQDSEYYDVYCDPNSKNQCMTKYDCHSVAYVENGVPTNTTLYHACRPETPKSAEL